MSGCKVIVYEHVCEDAVLPAYQEYFGSYEEAVEYVEDCEECPACGGYVKTEIWDL